MTKNTSANKTSSPLPNWANPSICFFGTIKIWTLYAGLGCTNASTLPVSTNLFTGNAKLIYANIHPATRPPQRDRATRIKKLILSHEKPNFGIIC